MAYIELSPENQQITVCGELSFATAADLRREVFQYITQLPTPIKFVFAKVTRCDSAGVALVLDWIRHARQLNKTIKLLYVPQQLLAIAEVSGLTNMLPVVNCATTATGNNT